MTIALILVEIFTVIMQRNVCEKAFDRKPAGTAVQVMVWAAFYIISNVTTYFFELPSWLNMVIFSVTFFGVLTWLYEGSIRIKLVLVLFLCLIGMLSEVMVCFIGILCGIDIIHMMGNTDVAIMYTILSKLVWFVEIKIALLFLKKNKNIVIRNMDWLEVFIVPVSSIFIVMAMFVPLTDEYVWAKLLASILILIVNLFTFYNYNELQEILVEDGVFKAIAPHIDVDCDCEIEDLGGKLTLPPYVDPHIHLDYVFTARKQGATNGTGTLFEGIQRWSETKSDLTIDEIKARAIKAVKMEVSHGVQFIRTHADVTDPNLTALKALLELKEELKDIVTIQIVSFPQEGMYSYKDGDKLVEEGLKMGADCVGGIPHFEYCREFGEKSIHKVVELAVKYDKLIDVHCDESDDPMSRFVELLTAL